jgi:hypothetical protein
MVLGSWKLKPLILQSVCFMTSLMSESKETWNSSSKLLSFRWSGAVAKQKLFQLLMFYGRWRCAYPSTCSNRWKGVVIFDIDSQEIDEMKISCTFTLMCSHFFVGSLWSKTKITADFIARTLGSSLFFSQLKIDSCHLCNIENCNYLSLWVYPVPLKIYGLPTNYATHPTPWPILEPI